MSNPNTPHHEPATSLCSEQSSSCSRESPSEVNIGLPRINSLPNLNSPRIEPMDQIVNRKRMELQSKFSEIDVDGQGYITQEQVKNYLKKYGIFKCPLICTGGKISFVEFTQWMTSDKPNILQKALNGKLAIPNFQGFCNEISEIFEIIQKNSRGILPDYIPELANADPNLFGISLCTVDGQTAHFGNGTKKAFTLQHCVLPMLYCLGREQGTDLHQFIGREPSGLKFNAFSLNEEKKPPNPFVSTGGLICASQILPRDCSSKRFTNIYQFVQRMAGCPTTLDSNDDNSQISYSQCTYLSEKEHNDRNRALFYFMRSSDVKGISQEEGYDINDVLDFYVQCNSISCTTRELSTIASTLANSGVCPLSGERCIKDIHVVRDCLSLLYSCGMYDYSGTWAFTVGLPAKSGISGCLMIIVPGVCGMAIFSPLVDKKGHSVRAVDFCQMLNKRCNLSIFGGLTSGKLYTNRKL